MTKASADTTAISSHEAAQVERANESGRIPVVFVSPAPFRGVLPLPISALHAGKPVLGNPANRHRAIPLTFDQFRYGFANKRQRHNEGVTEIVKLEGRGHALTIDHGWQVVAETALNFVSRFQPTTGGN